MIYRTTPVALCAWATFVALWGWIGPVDWRDQKIRHRALVVGAALTALVYAVQACAWMLGARWAQLASPALTGASAFNVAVCAFFSVLLWWLRVWPAGDGKLFMLLGALYPAMNTSPLPAERWLSLVVLINVFVPAALFLFARSGWYVFQTRLVHRRRFLVQLGWRRELTYYAEAIAGAARGWPGLGTWWAAATDRPRERLAEALRWLIDLSWMTLISLFLSRLISSPLTLTAVSFTIFFLVGRARRVVGRGLVETARWAAAAAILWRCPVSGAQALALFAQMSVFSVFVNLGMKLSFRSMLASAVFLLPFSLPVSGLLIERLAGSLAGGTVPVLSRSLRAAAPWLAQLALAVNLAMLGLFFGATWLMSKLSDERRRFVRVPADVVPGLLPEADFLDMVRRVDRRYYERTLSRLYADGLTEEEARSLARWCKRRSIRLMPVRHTISFASWIFFGYFLSFCLGGGHVMELLR